MTKNEATAASTAERRRARTRTQLVLTPPRFAERSSKPTARTSRPDPEAWSHTSAKPAPTTMTMNATGIGPMVVVRTDTKSGLMTPWAVGRRVSEIPSRMLNVARVAMIEGILSPRISPALTRPRATPQRRTITDPDQDLGDGGVGADHEGSDDHPEADHAADGEIEIPDEECMGLRHGQRRSGGAPG